MIAIVALVGLAASSVLLAEYSAGTAVFCGAGGGCDVVRGSDYASIFGIHTPWLGVLFFAVALILLLWPARRALLVWATGGALAALTFLGIQLFVLKTFCIYCGVADMSALLVLALALLTPSLPRRRAAPLVAVGAAAAGALVTPAVITRARPRVEAAADAGFPEAIAREQRPGTATIVEFVDFECPFCRRLHGTIEGLVKEYGDRVRVVRKQHPLAMHQNARTAALAACCAEEEGAGDRMAEALFTAPPEDLTADGCARLAAGAGVEPEKFAGCMASERPAAKIAADAADARAAGIGQEAPIFYVGRTRFRGAQRPEIIRAAIDRELTSN